MMVYCENCFQEELEHYFIDSLGNVFCSEKCAIESKEWRDFKVDTLTEVRI